MTREELVKQKAHSLGQRCFPDANNMWARANFEAQWVSEACEEMAEWADKHPNPNTIKKIFEFALEKTNFLIADNLQSIDFEVLVTQAMKE